MRKTLIAITVIMFAIVSFNLFEHSMAQRRIVELDAIGLGQSREEVEAVLDDKGYYHVGVGMDQTTASKAIYAAIRVPKEDVALVVGTNVWHSKMILTNSVTTFYFLFDKNNRLIAKTHITWERPLS